MWGFPAVEPKTVIRLFTSVKWNIRCNNQAKEKLHLQGPSDSKSAITDHNNIFLTLFQARGTAQMFWLKVSSFKTAWRLRWRTGTWPSVGRQQRTSARLDSAIEDSEGIYFLEKSHSWQSLMYKLVMTHFDLRKMAKNKNDYWSVARKIMWVFLLIF